MNFQLIYPVLAMAGLTYAAGAFHFLTRVKAVRSGQVHIKYFRTYNEGSSTPLETKASHHFTNLFEIPVLFYAASAFAMILQMQGKGIEIAAWIFFISRAAHAYVHIGPNRIFPRMVCFFLGVFSSMAMWILIAVEVCGRGYSSSI
jgi:hypothetical protein